MESCSWNAGGVILDCCSWNAGVVLLECSWNAGGVLLECSWNAALAGEGSEWNKVRASGQAVPKGIEMEAEQSQGVRNGPRFCHD